MKLIVGLGNSEEKYRYTRHNIGFMVLEKLGRELLPVDKSEKAWVGDKKLAVQTCRVNNETLLVKPHTYMNRSGIAVLSLMNLYKVSPSGIWVVHDDIDLPLGKVRIRTGGGSAGHNGIESIIQTLQNADFTRFRLGIGKGKLDMQHHGDFNLHRREIEKYVLSPFKDREAGEVKKLIKKAVAALEAALEKGIENAMNRYN
ncbi:aminoacyl-tRNA hydrolase [Candidatus Gottesmanbacteria bacterium RBG_13_37_7]|uniref:Peptidyl-tRNA hydrolase n=1 Tax=Candidatus Gottesmanbacteria bacterium RBG_13_37_7 TaxID=1798369 RepID=A0A1F5YK48_9BACT|nr:MAG: aminoacyl-tRNA hydrolase [Candidatus Gottesmanbacteria bacterium RBG_13_37_7]